MIPDILKLFFERVNISPSEDILNVINKESILTIPSFINFLIDLTYNPNESTGLIKVEAERIINTMINSPINIILLKHLFEVQGPSKDQKIRTIKGNIITKSLPMWKQYGFDSLIRQIMLRPNGIQNVIKVLVELIGANRTNDVAFTIAKCICKPPINVDMENHYKLLSDQIVNLLRISNLRKIINAKDNEKDIHMEYLKFGQCVALECFHLFALINVEYARKYLLEPAFNDFLTVIDSNVTSEFEEPQIVIESDDFIDLLNTQNSLLNTFKPTKFVQQWLRSFSPIYISICNMSTKDVIQHKTISKQILVRLIELSHSSSQDTAKFIRTLAKAESSFDDVHCLHNKLEIRPTLCQQGLEIAVRCNSLIFDSNDNQDLVANALVEVLSELSVPVKNDVVGDLFIWLLQARLNLDTNDHCRRPIDLLINDNIAHLEQCRLVRATLLYALCTTMESHCFTKAGDILKFAQIAINHYSKMLVDSSEDQVSEKIIRENVDYALNMINYVMTHSELSPLDREILKEMFPILTNLIASYPNEDSIELMTAICTMIATKGLVNPMTNKTSSLIEDLSETVDPALVEAFEDVEDKEIPTKALGLDRLRDLLSGKNESALGQRSKIYNIFSHYLFHSESFIYLRAIRGLALLGDQFTDKLLPVIINKVNSYRRESTVEEWMVVSEVFMQIIRNLGETAPHYRNMILNCIMPQLSDPQEIIRASGVNNLGELCCQLEYAFSSNMNEIMSQVCNLLENDPCSQVKVACSIMIRKLILGKMDNINNPRPEIMRLHSILKLIRQSLERVFLNETDQIVLDHAAVAYKSYSDSIKSIPFIQDSSNFEKKISFGNSDMIYKYRKLNF